MKRAEKESMEANQHEILDVNPDNAEGVTPNENDTEEVTGAEINSALAKARKEAHPGNARRLMSKGKTSGQKKTAQIKNVNFENCDSDHDSELEDAINDYWNSGVDSEDEDF
jgi:hypothetical protein